MWWRKKSTIIWDKINYKQCFCRSHSLPSSLYLKQKNNSIWTNYYRYNPLRRNFHYVLSTLIWTQFHFGCIVTLSSFNSKYQCRSMFFLVKICLSEICQIIYKYSDWVKPTAMHIKITSRCISFTAWKIE